MNHGNLREFEYKAQKNEWVQQVDFYVIDA